MPGACMGPRLPGGVPRGRPGLGRADVAMLTMAAQGCGSRAAAAFISESLPMKTLALAAAMVLGAVDTTPAADKPNVLFIAVDDLNHWVGYLGRNPQTQTPNIDRLAARGVRFTRSYCAAPVCNPSRAALMSGLRPSATGVYYNGNDWRPAIPADRTLTTAFRQAGYYVCGAGKIYHDAYPRRERMGRLPGQKGRRQGPASDRRRRASAASSSPRSIAATRTCESGRLCGTASTNWARTTTSRSSWRSACTSRTCRGTSRGITSTCTRSTVFNCRRTARTTSRTSRPPESTWPGRRSTASFSPPAAGRKPSRLTWPRSRMPTRWSAG